MKISLLIINAGFMILLSIKMGSPSQYKSLKILVSIIDNSGVLTGLLSIEGLTG